MDSKKLHIAQSEYDTLKELMQKVNSNVEVTQACYDKLRTELADAVVMPDAEMPENVVRLYSKIDVETPYGLLNDYQVVMPKDADNKAKKLSILSPMGSALIGYAEGDEVLWTFPVGERKITIKKVVSSETNKG